MNREKVLNNLMDIREIADNVNHPISEDEKDKCMQTVVDVAGETIKEVNSKSVMPKVFDEWMNYVEDNIELELQLVLDMDTALDEPSENLRDWLNEKSSESFIEKINRCTNAILHGYEVEK